MERFDGRVVYVTGAAHGIGRTIAIRLGREGASVTVADLDIQAAERVTDEVTDSGGSAFAVRCDVTDRTSVDAGIAASIERFGQLDVLVNAAGGDAPEPPFAEADDDLWQRLLDLNLTSTMRCIRAALPHLLASTAGGNVVTIGSVNGLSAFGSYPYSAAKAGLQIVHKNFAAEYGRRRLRFNLVAPGTVRTRVWDNQPGVLDRLATLDPLGRVGEPEDIAAAVAFLASDDAAWITGTTLPVDGGILAGPRAILADLADHP
ncbi:MAG: glucose 1-dehydrogenase [Chloroflexota bacterium]|nr:glucose 1-dehydrogenase [Chloroflexota bacterium]